jgi:hypothetical protein|tara:strand:+ start:5457 stop:5630 length:174 start_codon:yes stop_codon:yes gene_type:complete
LHKSPAAAKTGVGAVVGVRGFAVSYASTPAISLIDVSHGITHYPVTYRFWKSSMCSF